MRSPTAHTVTATTRGLRLPGTVTVILVAWIQLYYGRLSEIEYYYSPGCSKETRTAVWKPPGPYDKETFEPARKEEAERREGGHATLRKKPDEIRNFGRVSRFS